MVWDETIISEVLTAFGMQEPPIDVLKIAEGEGIISIPISRHRKKFYARIEYHPSVGKFLLYHPEIEDTGNNSVVRFSIAHELGHYYLPEHRKLLLKGCSHNSMAGFISDNLLEKEADLFAAALLMPERWILKAMKEHRRTKEFLTLKDIITLAKKCEASITSAAIRYAKYTAESCAIVMSKDGKILTHIPSDETMTLGLKWVGDNKAIPFGTATSTLTKNPNNKEIETWGGHLKIWYPNNKVDGEIWEEAFRLGNTGLILTLLAIKPVPEEDY